MEDDRMVDRDPSEPHQSNGDSGDVIGSAALRPVFLGNLHHSFTAGDVIEIFERPLIPPDLPQDAFDPIPVDRVDLKRGYCFVFLKDAASQADKERAERFVSDINGM
jgi:arginine/serine-rich splicing factor 4/5/6